MDRPPGTMRAMIRRITIIQGHPDATARHFCHALADAYADGVREAGGQVRIVDVARLDFPILRSQAAWEEGELPETLGPAQNAIGWAEHLLFVFPLWMGGMPALLSAFLEQVLRPGFASMPAEGPHLPKKLLTGRSARCLVTMGMPAAVYRYFFRAHALKSLERNVLGMSGIAPIHKTLVGSVAALGPEDRAKWLAKVRAIGQRLD